jgi:hypothetical protein
MTEVDLLVMVVSFPCVFESGDVLVKVRVVVTVQRTADAAQGFAGAQVRPMPQHFGLKDVSRKQ